MAWRGRYVSSQRGKLALTARVRAMSRTSADGGGEADAPSAGHRIWRFGQVDLDEGDGGANRPAGHPPGTIEERLASCDTVVFLDLSRALCLLRVILRRMRFRGVSRPDITAHCPERLTWEFIRWIWTCPRRRRPRILARLSTVASEKRIVILRSRADVRAFVDSLQNGGTDGTDAVES